MEGTETTELGWKTIGRYWGFRYTAATRNDDIIYIIPACLIALSYALFCSGRGKKVLYFMLFIVFALVTALSFSRGHILALFIVVFTVLLMRIRYPDLRNAETSQYKSSFKRFAKLFVGMLGIVALVILLVFIIGFFVPEFSLLVNLWLKILSIIDPSAQAEALNVSSSNSDRIYIYFIALDLLLKYPLGVGAQNFIFASIAENHGIFWGESTYLEYLVDWGVLGGLILVPLFLYPVLKLYYMFCVHRRFLDITYFAIALYLAIASVFNVLIGNLYVYILLSMIHAYIIHHKRQSAERSYSL
ncbi:O-antigen ligase family protein [Gammaproteobacteria bacterium]|nr:O-antigen ligase family protein [Gammaproteobacteria bacterium]